MNDLENFVSPYAHFDPAHLLAGLTFKAWQIPDPVIAIVEYAHHLILTGHLGLGNEIPNQIQIEAAFEAIKDLFTHANLNSDFSESTTGGIAHSTASHSLFVRGSSFPIHQFDFLEGFLALEKDWLLTNLNLRSEDLLEAARHAFFSVYNNFVLTIGIERIWSVDPDEMSPCSNLDTCGESIQLAPNETVALFRLTNIPDPLRSVVDLFTMAPNARPNPRLDAPSSCRYLCSNYPFLFHNGSLYCFYTQGLAEQLPRIIADWIKTKSPRHFDKHHVKVRESYVAKRSVETLCRVLMNAKAACSAYYPTPDGNRAETDGLVFYDGTLFVLEAKAHILTDRIRSGESLRVEGSFQKIVGDAFHQGCRVLEYVKRNPIAEFTDEKGRLVLSLPNKAIRKCHIIIVTQDCMTPWTVKLADARNAGMLTDGPVWPWVIHCNNLCVIADILDTPSQFLLYTERRTRFNRQSGWFHASDELDLLDLFMSRGLLLPDDMMERMGHKDAHFVWQGDTKRFTRFFANRLFKRPSEKPEPTGDAVLRRFVASLDASNISGSSVLGTTLLSLEAVDQKAAGEAINEAISRLILRKGRPQSVTVCHPEGNFEMWMAFEYTSEIKEHLISESQVHRRRQNADRWQVAFFLVKYNVPQLVDIVPISGISSEPQTKIVGNRQSTGEDKLGPPRTGRNDPCPCGSGRKYKKCHGPDC